ESRVVEADRAVPFDRDERRDRARGRVEEPEPGGPALGEGPERPPEEPLHPVVHEARLADARAPVEREKVCEPRLDVGGRAHGRDVSIGWVALATSDPSLEPRAGFCGKAGAVELPG